jgi:hypothetical protein
MTRTSKGRRLLSSASVVGAVVAFGISSAPAAAAAASTSACSTAHRSVIKSSPELLIFSPPGSDNGYVCVRDTGKVRRLWVGDGIYTVGYVHSVRGQFVAYNLEVTPACKADCPEGVVRSYRTAVMDATTGKRRILGTNVPFHVVLRATGTVAYLTQDSEPYELYVWDSAGRRLIDSGAILGRSVGLTDTAVRWTNGTLRRSAPVG